MILLKILPTLQLLFFPYFSASVFVLILVAIFNFWLKEIKKDKN